MSKLKLAAVVAGIAAVAVCSVAFASVPDGNGVIHGCYGKPGTIHEGWLRAIDTAQGMTCQSNESPLDWNKPGTPGQPGQKGDKGDKGDTGDPGTKMLPAVFIKRVDQVKLPKDVGKDVLVASLTLPPDPKIYNVTVTAMGTSWEPLSTRCILYQDGKSGTLLDQDWIYGDANQGAIVLNDLTGAPADDPITLDLYCDSVGEDLNWVEDVRIVAVQIGELNTDI
jgi:hypothetical protein